MKKVIFLIFLIIIYALLNNVIAYKSSSALKLDENEISITFVDKNIMITNNVNTFVLLNNSSDINKYDVTNLIKLNNINISIKNTYLLNKKIVIDDVIYNINNNLIEIKYSDNTFCIYNDYITNNIIRCNFLYLYNINNIENIDIDENTNVIFFDENIDIPAHFLEDIYSKWIDVYKLNTDYVILKLSNEDYQILVMPNNGDSKQ